MWNKNRLTRWFSSAQEFVILLRSKRINYKGKLFNNNSYRAQKLLSSNSHKVFYYCGTAYRKLESFKHALELPFRRRKFSSLMNDFFETPTKIIRQVFEFNVIKIHEISKRIDLITKEGDMRAVSLSHNELLMNFLLYRRSDCVYAWVILRHKDPLFVNAINYYYVIIWII